MTRLLTRKISVKKTDAKTKGNAPNSPFTDAVDDLQSVLNGIPDKPALKLMTFDEVKNKVTKGKGPSKRSNTYKAIGDKLTAAQVTLKNATLDGVSQAGGPDAFRKLFEDQLNELTTAIAAYQKHHKGKKADAIAPLLTDIKVLRGEMSGMLAALDGAKKQGFQNDTSIETVSDFRTIDDALNRALGKSTFKTKTLADLTKPGGRAAIEQAITQELNALENAIGTTSPGGANGPDVLAGIKRVKAGLKGTLDDLVALQSTDLPTDLKIADAAAALKAGIKPAQLKGVCLRHCNFAEFNVDTEVPPPKKSAGSGNCSTVLKINYDDGPRIFKEEKPSDTSGSQGAWAPGLLGIDKLNDARYGNRNIASSLVGDLVGSNVLVKSTFALSTDKDGQASQVGLLMEQAPGASLQRAHIEYARLDLDDLFYDGETGFDDFDEFANYKCNELVTKWKDQKAFPFEGMPSPKAMASLQKQLIELEVCDLLSGQVDRHSGNYLIEVKGDQVTVKGIDNDFAFGSDNKGGIPLSCPVDWMGPNVNAFNNIKNLPKLISQEMADKIQAMDFDRDVAPQFDGLLIATEIKAAKDRFDALQNHVTTLVQAKCVVTDWETWRSEDGKSATEFLSKGSMFGRDILPMIEVLERAQAGANAQTKPGAKAKSGAKAK